jgi:putative transposase
MAERTWAPRLGDRTLCHHARPCTFLCSAELDAKTLPTFLQAWKQWTSKRMARELKLSGKIWQEEFFDHVLRSSESYSQKWAYVKENPVRIGLVRESDEWPW